MLNLKNIFILFIISFISIIFTSCGAHYNSIHYSDMLNSSDDTVISVDAKQRVIVSNVIEKNNDKIRRFCAEPSPDVFSVLSSSFATALDLDKSSKDISAAIKASYSNAEAGSTISRTQTINMLKEMMYRTCERYMNGQIGEYESPVIAARDQRIMVSILAIEQLTGTVTPKPIVIGSSGESSTQGSSMIMMENIIIAKTEMEKAKTIFEDAEKERQAIGDLNQSCIDVNNINDSNPSAEQNATKEQCDVQQIKIDTQITLLTKAEADYNTSKDYYNNLSLLTKHTNKITSKTNVVLLSKHKTTEADKEIEVARLNTIQKVSSIVQEIVSKSFKQSDETSFFCYRILDKNTSSQKLTDACSHFLTQKIEGETKLNEKKIEANVEAQNVNIAEDKQKVINIQKTETQEEFETRVRSAIQRLGAKKN